MPLRSSRPARAFRTASAGRIRALGLGLLLCAGTACAADGHPAHAAANAPVPAVVNVPLDAASRAGLARHPVKASAHGQALDCEGVSLLDLLRHTGALPATPLRGGAQLGRRIEARARDGYRVTFSAGELDPELGNRRVYLVDRCDGAPLPDATGPLRLVVPEDARPARWIRQLERIDVLAPH